ncbi:hypothetical protein OG453_11020 [Streptomyces sp. NBC_01381]|uniref:hypothetical protein n=1 Tax=Streptomyces sp. NBC_01381 TaxID=2903845 RepID=UPI00225ACEA0|nr:hypothetical protein [Streptomyces sp. NBC_01381]MCX4667187.1 hypothetical protein [Streptomyces sp. NBC_01381]
MPGTHDEAYEALMLAVTGDPVPDEVRDDPEFRAEHAAAVADVALLRERLAAAGDALAAPGPAPGPAVAVRPDGVRRRRAPALALAAATAAAALIGGLGWLAVDSGGGITQSDADTAKGAAPGDDKAHDGTADDGTADDGAAEDLTDEGYVACARLIVEGTVRRVEAIPGAEQDRIVLDVSRYYKPDSGKKRITFVMNVDVDPRLRPGDRTLIGIPRGGVSPDIWSTGDAAIAKERAWIERALPGAEGLSC